MNNRREIIYPTPEEDAEITAAALSDIDALPLTDNECEQILQGKPLGPRDAPLNFYLERDLMEALKKTGGDWEWRTNGFLREYAGRHGMFKALLRLEPAYQEQEGNANLVETRREFQHEAWLKGSGSRVVNFHIHMAVEDAFMVGGKGWAKRINEILREYVFEQGLLDRQ
jgi:uncharacterized protein (DUF4415 family)